MYTIEKLNEKSDVELADIAKELSIKASKADRKDLIYSILDAQAEQTAVDKPAKRRRRVGEKAQAEAVYSANENGESKSIDTPPAKKKRGRPSKAELAKRAEEEAKTLFTPIEEVPKAEAEPAEAPAETAEPKPARKKRATKKEKAEEKAAEAEVKAEPIEEAAPEAPAAENTGETAAMEQSVAEKAPEAAKFKPALKVSDQFYVLTDIADAAQAVLAADVPARADKKQGANSRDGRLADLLLQTEAEGVLDLQSENSGILRSADYNYLPSPDDIQIGSQLIRQYSLKTGDTVAGQIRLPRGNEKHYVMTSVTRVNGLDPKMASERIAFEHLTPLFPDEKFKLCTGNADSLSCRVVDLFSPIGKGQRALIVAQPKTGKTWLMKDIANAIAHNNPNTYLIMLLIDERPEEVTDMIRTVDAEVIASTFDEPASNHVRIAKLVLEKAKRLVECGRDVVIFLDSITRLARAFNTVSPSSGKVLTGGVEANSLQHPKRFFGAARNIEGGGSLTIVATALIDTGSKMDEVIFEEFKGTGNMELQLDRVLSNKRIYPSVNLIASSTRRDDLLLDEAVQQRMWILRKHLADMNPVEAMTEISKRLSSTRNNEEFLITMNG
ncbi:MAG: transcription termination factor Rho [Alloprevotella sp.]|nr:transcription termination factor Rho [Alloprevotella sp.]